MLQKSKENSTTVSFMPESIVNSISEFLTVSTLFENFFVLPDYRKNKETFKKHWPNEERYVYL